MPGTTIHLLLVEQDFCGRINLDMTITDRRKADCWKIAQQNQWITQTGRATKPKVRAALEELVFIQAANFDTYTPGHAVAEALGGQDILDSVLAEAKMARAFAVLDEVEDDYTCVSGLHHADDPCDCE